MLEIRQEARSLKESLELVADAVVCLANAHGGRIVVGVLDDVAGPGALVGVGDSLTCDTVVRGIFDRTVPSLSVPVEEIERKGNCFIVITVPRGGDALREQPRYLDPPRGRSMPALSPRGTAPSLHGYSPRMLTNWIPRSHRGYRRGPSIPPTSLAFRALLQAAGTNWRWPSWTPGASSPISGYSMATAS